MPEVGHLLSGASLRLEALVYHAAEQDMDLHSRVGHARKPHCFAIIFARAHDQIMEAKVQRLGGGIALWRQEEVFRLEIDASGVGGFQEDLLNVGRDATISPSARLSMCPPMNSGDIALSELCDGACATAHSDNSCSRF